MALTRADILAADDLQPVSVQVPGWGGDVWVRRLTARQFVQMSHIDFEKDFDAFAKVVVMAACTEHGDPLFTPEDVQAISGKGFQEVKQLAQAVLTVNGMGAGDSEALGNSLSGMALSDSATG